MSRFDETKVNSTSGTVTVGAGLTWDQVYETLEPTGVNVVGGRVPGVGIAGLTLGGGEYIYRRRAGFQMSSGFAYTSSEYGLTVDNVAAYELVLPNGTVINVTSKDEDLWFGLRVSTQAQYRLASLLRVFNCRGG
jgi:FAD/FMN-containing dehydrogenase